MLAAPCTTEGSGNLSQSPLLAGIAGALNGWIQVSLPLSPLPSHRKLWGGLASFLTLGREGGFTHYPQLLPQLPPGLLLNLLLSYSWTLLGPRGGQWGLNIGGTCGALWLQTHQ